MNLRALLELCRISNLPTVWSNCAVGWIAGITTPLLVSLGEERFAEIRAFMIREMVNSLPSMTVYRLLPLAVIFSLLYSGGMMLNDFIDREIDRVERPSRPIPSGRVAPKTALLLSLAMLFAGVVGMATFEWMVHDGQDMHWYGTIMTIALLVMIVGYNFNHAEMPIISVILMGQCRAFIVLAAASIMQPPTMHWAWWIFIAGPALTLFVYTLAISIVARREMETKRFAGPKTIMNMIAAMPLLDAVWLVVIGLWPASLFCVACAGMTKLAHRKVAGS